MHFTLLLLDEKLRVGENITHEISKYVWAFFHTELRVKEIPKTVVAAKGWQALKERTVLPLQVRPGRPGGPAEGQISAPDLLACLTKLKKEKASVHGVEVDGAECILGLTGMEFFSDTSGTFPGQPVPAELTQRIAVSSEKQKVGVCSLARLDDPLASESGRRRFHRQVLTLVTHTILSLLGLRTCQSKTCLAYLRPFSLEEDGLKGTSFLLCAKCEHDLIRKIQPNIAGPPKKGGTNIDPDNLILTAADRYCKLAQRLDSLNVRLQRLACCGRSFEEFGHEYEWLCNAEQILLRNAGERKTWLDKHDKPHLRRRCLLHCIQHAHKEQEQRPLQRSCSQPLLRRRCLLDMAGFAPHNQGFFSSLCLDFPR